MLYLSERLEIMLQAADAQTQLVQRTLRVVSE